MTYYINNDSDNYRHASFEFLDQAKEELQNCKGEGNVFTLWTCDDNYNIVIIDSVN